MQDEDEISDSERMRERERELKLYLISSVGVLYGQKNVASLGEIGRAKGFYIRRNSLVARGKFVHFPRLRLVYSLVE